MSAADRWLLPDGIEAILPPAARRLEQLRRRLLDLYAAWGYELVIPPVIEFLDSLLIGTGTDLDLQTFKLIDPLSGRLLGMRADLTPQVARIDAVHSPPAGPARLCYLGTVLRTHGDGFGGSRSPLQTGAELYGHAGWESDLEIVSLMLESLRQAGLEEIHLDLGHVGIFRSLVRQAGLEPAQEVALFDALQRKALPEIRQQIEELALPSPQADRLLALAELNGSSEVLTEARRRLRAGPAELHTALAVLKRMADALQQRMPALPITFDLAELRGYHYHTGMVFAAYTPGFGQEIARGGRYDDIGRAFGRARPATGFSTDLRNLLALNPDVTPQAEAIYAPADADPALEAVVQALRARGERVIRALPGADPGPQALGCDRCLCRRADAWIVLPADSR